MSLVTIGFTQNDVMPGLDPGIHAFLFPAQGVDGRVKPGHDGAWGGECGRGEVR
ncbi:hypothetical protein MWN33_18890 [Starkeya koreensis]|uniref:Uncharacterized protein n=1 Tax=Ancylobacter koreensis TaxID=266121 RepID=A0ABT0DS50_9HYPH|nr:hypothetical protein [Ancylobacter koreensis]MCK0210101.1 hypothetical protein [Ancylobacter koreensis]